MEIVLSASPDFFRPDAPSAGGTYRPDRMKAWASKSLQFAKRTWGDNLICADLHLDESTPHFHLVVTPISEKKRKKRGKEEYYLSNVLDANSMFGPKALSRLQTEYGEELKPLGIKRGIKGSPAQHQPLSEFYKLVNESTNQKKSINVETPPLRNREEWARKTEKRLNAELAKKDAKIEFQRRKIGYLSRSIAVLERFGGFKNVARWFKRFGQLKKDFEKEQTRNFKLEAELERVEDNFETEVENEVAKQTQQLRDAYKKKAKENEMLIAQSRRFPAPKGP